MFITSNLFAIEKVGTDECRPVHFFWGLAGNNIREIRECIERNEEWWYVDVGYLTEQITRYPELKYTIMIKHILEYVKVIFIQLDVKLVMVLECKN